MIHVESITRPDGMRMSGGVISMEGAWWERSSHFLCANTNKRGLTLDLSSPQGIELLRRLIAETDVVIENFTPRVMANFGLEWPTIREINPRCVLVRMPAFGLSGSATESAILARGARLRCTPMRSHQSRGADDVNLCPRGRREARHADSCLRAAVGMCVEVRREDREAQQHAHAGATGLVDLVAEVAIDP